MGKRIEKFITFAVGIAVLDSIMSEITYNHLIREGKPLLALITHPILYLKYAGTEVRRE